MGGRNIHGAAGCEPRISDEGVSHEITYLESEVILAIENEGWFPGLWFPIVDREALNFGIWRFIKN